MIDKQETKSGKMPTRLPSHLHFLHAVTAGRQISTDLGLGHHTDEEPQAKALAVLET